MESDLVQSFQAAVAASKQLPARPDHDALLRLYALYKQATAGDVAGDRPGGFDVIGKAKYDAWAGLKGVSSRQAMSDYVELVETLQAAAG